MLAGPSEVLVIADSTADVETVAADLLAQVFDTKTAVGGRGAGGFYGNLRCLQLSILSFFSGQHWVRRSMGLFFLLLRLMMPIWR